MGGTTLHAEERGMGQFRIVWLYSSKKAYRSKKKGRGEHILMVRSKMLMLLY